MENIPVYIPAVFIATTFITLLLLYKASRNARAVLVVSIPWLAVQAGLGLSKFYLVTDTVPTRIVAAVMPPVLLIIGLFVTARGRAFLDNLDVKWLTFLHVVRVPVEMVLFWLFIKKYVPQLMTFEGRNFDILSGISAPVVYYFGFVNKQMGRTGILIWNFICLALLLNIVIHAVLSVPNSFQQLAFEQPNVAILYFPFVWLPGCVVPLVLLSHLAAIRQLLYPQSSLPNAAMVDGE